jgi:hypothetical protein
MNFKKYDLQNKLPNLTGMLFIKTIFLPYHNIYDHAGHRPYLLEVGFQLSELEQVLQVF